MVDLNEVVRKNIIIIMNQKKITIPYITSRTKISTSLIYKYMKGDRKISLKFSNFLAKLLNIPIKNLFDEDIHNEFKDVYTYPYKSYGVNKDNKNINERDKAIYFYRKISSNKKTLRVLGNEFNISRERVRQIQNKIEKQIDLRRKTMKVIKRGGHYIVTDMINGVLVSEKFLVSSKKEAIKKFKEKHKQKEK